MKNFLNKLSQGVMIIDLKGRIQFCNDVLIGKLFYSEEELIGEAIEKVINIDEEELEDNRTFCERSIENTNFLKLKKKNEETINTKVDITKDLWENKEVYVLSVEDYQDGIYTKEELEQVLDTSPQSIWIEDYRGAYRYANQKCLDQINDLSGKHLTKKDILGKDGREVWGKVLKGIKWKEDNELLLKGQIFSEERCVKCPGRILHHRITKIPIMDENKKIKYVIVFDENRTAQKEFEKHLANSYYKRINFDEGSLIEDAEAIKVELGRICEEIRGSLGAESLGIYLYDNKKEELKLMNQTGTFEELFKYISATSYGDNDILEFIEDKTYWKPEELMERLDISINSKEWKGKIKLLSKYPIFYNDELIGIIAASYSTEQIHEVEERNIINSICNNVAILIKNTKLTLQFKEEFDKRKQIEREQQAFINLATDLVGVMDLNFCLKQINKGWEELLGWSKEELINISATQLIHPEDRINILDFYRRLISKQETVQLINRCLCKSGEYKWIAWNIQYIKERGVCFLAAKDITLEKSIEAERIAYKEAKQLENVKNEFFCNISHELRTPLNIILSMFQLMEYEESHLSEEQKKVMDFLKITERRGVIRQNMYRLLRLMNNLIDMTRIDTGYFDVKLINCDMVSVVEDITMSVVKFIKSEDINITFDTEVEELVMACDPDKIERIMLNLLSNAVKYTGEKGEIFVSIQVKNDKCLILVQDNGVGIPKQQQNNIFCHFMQVDNLLTRKCEGSGIGLTLTKALVEMHKGSIHVESELDKGSTFIVEIPIHVVGDGKVQANRVPKKTQVEKCNIEFSDIYNLHIS